MSKTPSSFKSVHFIEEEVPRVLRKFCQLTLLAFSGTQEAHRIQVEKRI